MSQFPVSMVKHSELSEILGTKVSFPSRWDFPAAFQDTNEKPFTRRDDRGNSVLDLAEYNRRARRSKRWLTTVDRIMERREAAFDRAAREPKVGKVRRVAVRSRSKATA